MMVVEMRKKRGRICAFPAHFTTGFTRQSPNGWILPGLKRWIGLEKLWSLTRSSRWMTMFSLQVLRWIQHTFSIRYLHSITSSLDGNNDDDMIWCGIGWLTFQEMEVERSQEFDMYFDMFVCTCFFLFLIHSFPFQIEIFWNQLSWPEVEGSYSFIAKILDVCTQYT